MKIKAIVAIFGVFFAAGNIQFLGTTAFAGQDVTLHDVRDPATGMIKHRVPLPKGWKIDQDPNNGIDMVGPDNVVVHKIKPETFVYSKDQFTLESARMMGKQIHPIISLEEYLHRYLLPTYSNQGYKFIKSYPIPDVVNRNHSEDGSKN